MFMTVREPPARQVRALQVSNLAQLVAQESGVPVDELARQRTEPDESQQLRLRLARGLGVRPDDVEVSDRQVTLRRRATLQIAWIQSEAVLRGVLKAIGNPLGAGLVAENLGRGPCTDPGGLLKHLGCSLQGLEKSRHCAEDLVINCQDAGAAPTCLALLPPEEFRPPSAATTGFRPLTAEDRKTLAFLGIDAKTAEAVRSLVAQQAVEPDQRLLQAMQSHRVLGFGERHGGNMVERKLLLSLLPRLKQAGATHLALEVDATYQPVLDRFGKTGELDLSQLPEFVADPAYQTVLQEARKVGLTLLACDDQTPGAAQEVFPEDGRRKAEAWTVRDRCMTSRLEEALDQDPGNKVVFLVGEDHLDDGRQGTTASRLRDRGHSLFTMSATDPALPNRLAVLTEDSQVPLGLERKTASRISAALAKENDPHEH